MLDAECYQHIKPPDPLTEPEVTTSRTLSHNAETVTIRTVPPTSSLAEGGSKTKHQHSNGDVRYV